MDAPNEANDVLFLHQTKIGKRLDEFDKLPIAKQLEKFLSSNPACIKLFQKVVKKRGYVFDYEEVVKYFNEEYTKTSIPSFIIQRKCKGCNLDVEYISSADFDFDQTKSHSTRLCTKCQSPISIVENDYKQFRTANILSLFKYGVRCGIFKPYQYSNCPFCYEGFHVDKENNHICTNCTKCGKPVEIKVLFELDEIIFDYFEIIESQGNWFEWYLGYMIKRMKDRIVKRNQSYRIGERPIELDLLVEKNGNKICVNCSTEKEGKFDIENFYLIRKVCNKLVLACPNNEVPRPIVDSAKETFGQNNVSKITLNNFSDLDSLAKLV